MAEFARKNIQSGKESEPWNQPGLVNFDRTSVADALEHEFGVSKQTEPRLWQAMELLLVNNNVAPLEHIEFPRPALPGPRRSRPGPSRRTR